jgi:hypothetical protein
MNKNTKPSKALVKTAVMLSLPDIRNKLSPITNLIAMLESSQFMYHDNPEIHKLMEEEIKQCKVSIAYLSNGA